MNMSTKKRLMTLMPSQHFSAFMDFWANISIAWQE